ncbi:MAG: hemolysin family protein [Bacteroidota bacterium]
MALEIVVVLLLIVANGVFSFAEIAIVSSRKSRLEAYAKKGDEGARLALKLSNEPTRLLATVQIGITLIGILTGAFGGTLFADNVAVWIRPLPVVGIYADTIALFLVVLVITYLSLIIGELVPKKLALTNPEKVARVMARPMNFISMVSYPAVWFLSHSTDIIVKFLKLKPSDEPNVTEDEIKSLMAQGTNLGEFAEVEQDIIERVFHMSDRKVGSLMTNRLDMEWLDANDDFEINRRKILTSSYSSFALCDDEIDKVVGIVYTKKFLISLHDQDSFSLLSIAEKPVFIPENMNSFKVLEKFKEKRTRICIVVDEFGAVQGMVTMSDITEALLGEPATSPESGEEAEIIAREDGTWLIDALLSFEEFIAFFELSDVDTEDRTGFHTLGGFILHLSEQIPRTGEIFTWRNFSFEVIDMDGNRIDKILVSQKTGHEVHNN